MLPPRAEGDALPDPFALQSRLADIEQQIARLSDAAALRSVELMRLPTRLPLAHATLGSPFGNRDDPFTGRRAFHSGLDFAAEKGAAIHAAAGGSVVSAAFRSDYGWVVEIDHGNGLHTRYAHASRLLVKAGDVVAPGETIAAVGTTGRSTGPHLHFEVLRGGEATDPRRYLAGL
jgi:murein DD-endopeptidase MepM/ murein hydrolase activator NlpD